MRKIKVLYGFNNDKVMGNIEKALKALGRESLTSIRPNKPMIKEFIDTHPDLDVVVLKEYLDGGDQYGVEEFIELVQHTHVRFIILIGENYRGRREIAELYAEGILDALFSDGKVGIDTATIAELMVCGRTHAEAKKYYRIAKGIPERRKVTSEEYRCLLNYLKDKDKGANLMDRFVTVSRMITPMQMGHFITLLPDGMIKALKKYKEYYELNSYIYKITGYQACQKMKAPANARSGLTREIFEQKLKGSNLSRPDDYSEVVIEAAPHVTDDVVEERRKYRDEIESRQGTYEEAEPLKESETGRNLDMREYADRARRNAEARREEEARILEEELRKVKKPAEAEEEEASVDVSEDDDFDNSEMSLIDMLGDSSDKAEATAENSRSVKGTVEEEDEDEEEIDVSDATNVSDMDLGDLLKAYS